MCWTLQLFFQTTLSTLGKAKHFSIASLWTIGYGDIKDIQTHCVPIDFEDIETEIIGDEEIVQGPKIKNLVIRKCACTEVQTCY